MKKFKTVSNTFQSIYNKYPTKSSYLCLIEALQVHKIYKKDMIKHYFDKLVGKDDYAKNEKKEILI